VKYTCHIVDTYRVRIFSPRAELDFAGHPSVGTACALVMKQHVRLSDPVRLILEENVGPVIVDVAPRNGGFHGTLTLSGKIEAPTGAPSLTDSTRCSARNAVYREDQWQRRSKHTELES
jgi:PhzF family phenazine biosynthesis protein